MSQLRSLCLIALISSSVPEKSGGIRSSLTIPSSPMSIWVVFVIKTVFFTNSISFSFSSSCFTSSKNSLSMIVEKRRSMPIKIGTSSPKMSAIFFALILEGSFLGINRKLLLSKFNLII